MSPATKITVGLAIAFAAVAATTQTYLESFIKPKYAEATSTLRGEQINKAIDQASGAVQATEAKPAGLKQFEPPAVK